MPKSSLPNSLWWLGALADPAEVKSWDLEQWQYVMRMSRRMRLFGRLAEGVNQAGLDAILPTVVRSHLLGEQRRSRARLRALRWVISQVTQALEIVDVPKVLLKGAAYVVQGLPIAQGRLPSDVDILVPKSAIYEVQRRLLDHDWLETVLDEHDQRYYREWSHEMPPMRNARFELELDLHHAILPPVARTKVATEVLLDRLTPSGLPGWHVLCPADQVLHSAAHLFFESELQDRARDLIDIDGLIRHFDVHPEFWDDVMDRAVCLTLVEPLFLALRLCTAWLDTPVPKKIRAQLDRSGPGPLRRAWLLPMMESALTSVGPDDCETSGHRMAALGVLLQYHLWRMPMHLLIPHLWHKSTRRPAPAVESDDRV